MLDKIAGYNDLSPKLRDELEKIRKKAGNKVRYRFSIGRLNPDPQKFNGEYLFPALFTLGPVTYRISDPHDKGASKKIGLVERVNEKGEAEDFRRLRIMEIQRGEVILDLNKPEDEDMFAYLEFHPKIAGGIFSDTQTQPLFHRVDELKQATANVKERNLRAEAMIVAVNMSDEEVRNYAAAMNWDELDEIVILRDKVLEIADKHPKEFTRFIDTKNIEYRSTIKRAMSQQLISWIPLESKYTWAASGQTIATIEKGEGVDPLEKFADWLVTAKNGPEVYAKLKSVLNGKPTN